jgi:hypothetical protein
MYQTFSGLLCDAIFMVDLESMDHERERLAGELFSNPNSPHCNNQESADIEARRRLYCPGSKILEDKAQFIPPPDVLLP